MSRRLVLSPALRRALVFEARNALPEECCGVLLGRETTPENRVVTHIIPAKNVAAGNRAHSYLVDPRALLTAERWVTKERAILGVYHSHPRAAPTPSASDSETAVRGWSYLIVGVVDDAPPVLGSFRLAENGFESEEICYDVKGGGEDRSGET